MTNERTRESKGKDGGKKECYSHALNYFTATGFIFIAISFESSEFISSYVRLCVCCMAHIMKLNNNDSIRWLLNFFLTETRPFVARSPKLHEINFALFIYVRPLLLFIRWRKAFFSFGFTRENGFSYAFLLVCMLTASELRSESQFRRYLRIITLYYADQYKKMWHELREFWNYVIRHEATRKLPMSYVRWY